MSKKEKLLNRLCATPPPKDFTWEEMLTLMSRFEFKETCKGGSHYTFEHTSGFLLSMSKTHPSGILKKYQINDAKDALKHIGVLHE